MISEQLTDTKIGEKMKMVEVRLSNELVHLLLPHSFTHSSEPNLLSNTAQAGSSLE